MNLSFLAFEHLNQFWTNLILVMKVAIELLYMSTSLSDFS